MALAGPRTFAQPATPPPGIGLLLAGPADESAAAILAFRRALSENGLIPDKDVELLIRFSGSSNAAEASAAELADRSPSVLVGSSVNEVRALQRAAPHTPIVMVAVGDPVGSGLAASLELPGRLVTGFSDFRPDFAETRLLLLRELLPGGRRFGFLHNPEAPTAKLTIDAALRLGVDLVPMFARTTRDVENALHNAEGISMDAVVVVPYPASFQQRRRIGEWAARRRLPVVFGYAEYMDLPGEISGIASFGTDYLELYRRAAGYAAAILRGANPAELPIRRPEKGHLVVNLSAARRLNVEIPQSILLRADRVID